MTYTKAIFMLFVVVAVIFVAGMRVVRLAQPSRGSGISS